jgi:hypothetical protein
LLCTSLLIALLQRRAFCIAADPVLPSCDHGSSMPFSLRC